MAQDGSCVGCCIARSPRDESVRADQDGAFRLPPTMSTSVLAAIAVLLLNYCDDFDFLEQFTAF